MNMLLIFQFGFMNWIGGENDLWEARTFSQLCTCESGWIYTAGTSDHLLTYTVSDIFFKTLYCTWITSASTPGCSTIELHHKRCTAIQYKFSVIKHYRTYHLVTLQSGTHTTGVFFFFCTKSTACLIDWKKILAPLYNGNRFQPWESFLLSINVN